MRTSKGEFMPVFILSFVGFCFGLVSFSAIAKDKLVIISPHRKSIQQEFIPAFKEYYKAKFKTEVQVDWIDQGGTSDDLRFVRAKFKKNPKTTGIDIFWGGGTATFLDLKQSGFLAKHKLPKDLSGQIPSNAAGVPMYDKSRTWFASALSSFGIFYNKKLLKLEGVKAPGTWADLTDPKFNDLLSVTDPRRSGTATLMNIIILKSQGWEKGWDMLSRIAGNTRTFTHSSSDPIKAVVSGDAVAAMAIDFYANAKIADLGANNLGFALPPGQTVLDPDPVAILKGAPNKKIASRFINYVLSSEAQNILMLNKGAKGGPRLSFLGRMAVNTQSYVATEGKRVNDYNPFKQKSFLRVDLTEVAKTKRVINDLIGAIMVDTHKDLKKSWRVVLKSKSKEKLLKEFSKVPVTEKELGGLAAKWNDEVFRNKKINEWVSFAQKKFAAIK